MTHYVVDASVAAKWVFDEPHSEAAKRLLSRKNGLNVPDFFFLEMDNIFWKRVQRKEITLKEAETARLAFHQFPLRIHPFINTLDLAYTLAIKSGQSLYDSLYLALAILLDASLVTADRKFYEGLKRTPWAKQAVWVEDIGSEKS